MLFGSQDVFFMTSQDYKALSMKEFSKAAKAYETDNAGVYKMCRKDYPDVLAEPEKEALTDLLDCGWRHRPHAHPDAEAVFRPPLVNLAGHGDARVYGVEAVRELCRRAGLALESGETRGFFRLYCVARKPMISSPT